MKRTVADIVPKSIMLNLVHFSRDEMQKTLLADLYKLDNLKDIMEESESTVERRKECKKMIEALLKAEEIISTI